jgi:hypothetical protein
MNDFRRRTENAPNSRRSKNEWTGSSSNKYHSDDDVTSHTIIMTLLPLKTAQKKILKIHADTILRL